MFTTPMQTTPARNYNMQLTVAGIRMAEINDELVSHTDPLGFDLKFVPPGNNDFPPFNQPLTKLEIPALSGTDIVVDGRSFLRAKEHTPLKEDTYRFFVNYASFVDKWMKDPVGFPRRLVNNSDYHIKMFATWLTNEVGRRLALDPIQLAKLRMVFTVHYIQMTTDLLKTDTSKDAQMQIVTKASRTIPRSSPILAYEMLGDEIPYLSNITDTMEWAKRILDTPRTDMLNIGFLYSLVAMSTFPSLRETITVALEYPPAFILLIHGALTERGINKTQLGKTLMSNKDRSAETHFLRMVNSILQEK